MTRLTRAIAPSSPRRRLLLRAALITASSAVVLRLMCAAAPTRDREPLRAGPAVADRQAMAISRPEQDRQKLEAETRERIHAQAEATEVAFQREAVDLPWSREARELIARAVATEAPAATSVEELACRATLCRMRVSHRDPRARAAFEMRFPLAVAPHFPQVMAGTVETDGESPGSVLYLARRGHDLPGFEKAPP